MTGHLTRGVLVAILALLAAAPPAPAAPSVRFTRIQGYKAPGTPAKYDRVGILEVGPRRARNVLVLNPGTSASAAYFKPLAESIVAQAKGWQVWAVERRENLLEDHSMLDRAKAGQATPQQLFDYYLGYLDDTSVSPHFRLIGDDEVGFAREWGMRTEIEDLRRVVRRASGRGGKVVLGGHSLGGSITTAYATWDFAGRPGARGLSGLVFIDGGSRRAPISTADADARLRELASGSPWLSFGGIAAPFAGLFNSGGSALVRIAPDAPSIAQNFRLLPANLKPPVPATNAGEYGYALDTATSPAPLAAAQAHLGRLAPSGEPRGWVDGGELTPLRRMADMFSGWGLKGLDGTAWYHPLRLTIDAGAVAAGNDNPAQRTLGLRAVHGDDLPKRAADLRLRRVARGRAGAGGRPDAGRPVRHPPAPADARRSQRHLRPQRPELGRPASQRVPEGADPVPPSDGALKGVASRAPE